MSCAASPRQMSCCSKTSGPIALRLRTFGTSRFWGPSGPAPPSPSQRARALWRCSAWVDGSRWVSVMSGLRCLQETSLDEWASASSRQFRACRSPQCSTPTQASFSRLARTIWNDRPSWYFSRTEGSLNSLRQMPIIEWLLEDHRCRVERPPVEHIPADEYVGRETALKNGCDGVESAAIVQAHISDDQVGAAIPSRRNRCSSGAHAAANFMPHFSEHLFK